MHTARCDFVTLCFDSAAMAAPVVVVVVVAEAVLLVVVAEAVLVVV